MNRKNIYATIEILHHAQNFDITGFQTDPRFNALEGFNGHPKRVGTIEELHQCGNTACIAGYVALSPAWRDFGGRCEEGVPKLKELGANLSIEEGLQKFWGLSEMTVGCIVYGLGDAVEGTEWTSLEFEDFCAEHGITGMPEKWSMLTKDHAISLFEQLLALDEQGVAL